MEYTMEYVNDCRHHDEVCRTDGALVIIAGRNGTDVFFGTEIDYETSLLNPASGSAIPMSPKPRGVANPSKFRNGSRRSRCV